MINHVDTIHIADKSALRTRNARGAHWKDNDQIPQMNHDYGRIAAEIEYIEQAGERIRLPKCARCIYKPFARSTKAGIKQHLSRHNESGKAKISTSHTSPLRSQQ